MSPKQLYRSLFALTALLALGYNSLPCNYICEAVIETETGEHETALHCACAHSGESSRSTLLIQVKQADQGSGCSCISTIDHWRGQLLVSARIKEQQGKPSIQFFLTSSGFEAPAFPIVFGCAKSPPGLVMGNGVLLQLKTIVLNT